MFKNDRMMMIFTGLILAIFAGSMVNYGDRIMAFMSGDTVVASQDDSYSVRAGSEQVLDVLSNDKVKGPIVVLSEPQCGSVALSGRDKLTFTSDASCGGTVEFAYCVDSEGECSPNAVKVNVISLDFARTTPVEAQPDNAAEADIEVAQASPAQTEQAAPEPDAQAPEVAGFAVELLPPSLAAPSLSELVSPSVAVAAIRQPNGSAISADNLGNAQNTDQTIATQNSASIGQTALAGPTVFAAPTLGENSNIALGAGARALDSNVAAPTVLQPATAGGSNIVQLARGPEALASVQGAQVAPAAADSAPLSANPEVTSFAPVEIAAAQTATQLPDASFSAAPIDGGPIALIALNPTATGNAAGESLNVTLAEPGLQSFLAPALPPAALGPTSERPNTVTVLERAPNLEATLLASSPPSSENQVDVLVFENADRAIAQSPLNVTIVPSQGDDYASAGGDVSAALPNQVSITGGLERRDIMSPYIAASRSVDPLSRSAGIAALSAPGPETFSKPGINLAPAAVPDSEAGIVEASLPTAPESLDISMFRSPEQNSVCAITLSASERSGAIISLDILSQCQAEQAVTITHSGLSFSVLTDAQGAANVQFPALEQNAEILVEFADQSRASTTITVNAINNFVRAGVSWQADMSLALSAFEFGAAAGSEGHIRAEFPRDYRTSRIKGGGYLLQLGDPDIAGGAQAKVYTIPLSRSQQRGTIALSIVIEDTTSVCGQSITAKTVRTRENGPAGVRNVRFNVPACGEASTQIPLFGAIDDIRLAGR